MAQREVSKGSMAHALATVFNGSAPGADTAILSSGIQFGPNASMARVTVALTTGSVFNVTCTDGTTPHKWGLNESDALNAGDLYVFTFGVRSTTDNEGGGDSLTYNFEVETSGVIELLLVEEVQGGAI